MAQPIESWMNSSRLSAPARLANATLATINVSYENYDHYDNVMEVQYIFRVSLDDQVRDIDDFEQKLLQHDELAEMKRIIHDNPELRILYSKYKMMDELGGKQ
jgi:hypothetical protein